MNRKVKILIALFFILAIGITEAIISNNFLTAIHNESISISEEVSEANFLDYEIKNKVNALDSSWDNKEKILCLLVNHKDIQDLGEKIDLLKSSQIIEDYGIFKQNLDLIVYYSEAYQHMFGISIQNLF